MYIMTLTEIDLDSLIADATTTPQITEQKYLDLAQDCKNLIDEKDRQMEQLKRDNNNYKYIFTKIFGNIIMIDDLLSQMDFGSNIMYAVVRHTLDYIITDLKNLYEIEI